MRKRRKKRKLDYHNMKNKRKECPDCGSTKLPIKVDTPCGESYKYCPKCKIVRSASWLRRGK